MSLKDRINSYKEASSQRLMKRLPVVINVNGRGFRRLTSLIDKPYSNELASVFAATMVKLCQEIDGSVFAYNYNDDITIISRNDQTYETQPWFQNDVQKIASAAASIATLEFNNAVKTFDLNLNGEATFTSTVFAVPSILEAINAIIYKQQQCAQTSLSFASLYELTDLYGKDALDILQNRSSEDKIDLLEECGHPYDQYSLAFRRGIACYRAPMLSNKEGILKNKWIVNNELPIFVQDQGFLTNILKIGQDIVRA